MPNDPSVPTRGDHPDQLQIDLIEEIETFRAANGKAPTPRDIKSIIDNLLAPEGEDGEADQEGDLSASTSTFGQMHQTADIQNKSSENSIDLAADDGLHTSKSDRLESPARGSLNPSPLGDRIR